MGWIDPDERLVNRKIVVCEKCGGGMKYVDNGVYKCSGCGHEELNNLAKIQKFLNENGASPIPVISSATGVPKHTIEQYFREGRIESAAISVADTLRCPKCGKPIKSGRYCFLCKKEIAGGIRQMFNDDK